MSGEQSQVEHKSTDLGVAGAPWYRGGLVINQKTGEGDQFSEGDVHIFPSEGAGPVAIVCGLEWANVVAAAPELLAALKEMGDWIAAGLQASDEAWPDERCLKHTEEIAARARAAVDKAEGRA